jgi:2,5-diketo-D-gluconate reductase B
MKYFKREITDIPAIGLGTYLITGQDCIQIVQQALEVGYRHIDTAQMYNNESEVGEGISQSSVDRSDIFLTTKVWPDQLSKSRFLPSVEESLRKLKTDYVDLLLIHWPNKNISITECVGELMKAKMQQKARYIGLSNFSIDLLEQALDIGAPIITNQVEFHPFIDQSKLKDWTDRHDILLTAYTPLAQGRVVKDKTLNRLAEKYNKNTGQITLRWMIQQENVTAIPKSSNPERLISNLEIFDFELSPQEMAMIDGLKADHQRFVNPAMSPVWD